MKSGNRTTGQRKTSKSSSSKNVGRYEPLLSDDGEPSGCQDEVGEGPNLGAQSSMTMDRGARNTIDGANLNNESIKFDESQTMQLKEQIKEVICAEPILAKLVDLLAAALMDRVSQSVYAAINLDLEKKQREMKELEKKVRQLEKKLIESESYQEEQEQYTRRNCLRIYGVPEERDEISDDVVLDLFNSKLDLGFSVREGDLDRTHRIQPKKPPSGRSDQPRPLIVKFARYNVRQKVYAARMKLKKTRIYIREDLTSSRQELIRDVLNCESIKKAWTNDGRIRALTRDNKIVNVRHRADLEKI